MRAVLTIEDGEGVRTGWELSRDQSVTLGRNRNNAVVLQDRHASRFHAEIYEENGRWFLRDCGTLNGTKLNGQRISQAVPLADGSEIGIGDTRLRFHVEEGSNGTEPSKGAGEPPSITFPEAGPSDPEQTVAFREDELTALCDFMAASVEETAPRALIGRALGLLQRQTGATVAGFLSLDEDDPLPKVVVPQPAQVDMHLSKQLTLKAQ